METVRGRTVVLTGATSGIGKEIAIGLAGLGAKLILGCRDVVGGRAAAVEIEHRTDVPGIEVLAVDLSSGRSIREFARAVMDQAPRLDVLVNNAGVSRGSQPRGTNQDGVELTFATNVMGYFLLTQALLPRLRDSAPARIVNVASTFASDLDLDDLQFSRRPYEGMKAYAQSKACDRLLTWSLARKLEGSGVTANAMAPGLVVDTGLYRHTPAEVTARLRQRGGRTAQQGADTAVWLASDPWLQRVSGKFFENRKEIPCVFRSAEAEERLWAICEGLASA
jgi:NAD(P)-dependent dehydrogenase (short-subunit alcohol dehydrogenase family)